MNNAAILTAAISTPRPGKRDTVSPQAKIEPVAAGLELSGVEYRPREFFKLNPANEPFRAMKSDSYLADLERDIRDNGIMDEILAMPDGLVIAGESRLICGERAGVKKYPVKFILSDLAPEEQEKRLILHNLLRFEIDKETRLALLYRVGFYERPRAEVAEALRITERQVARDRSVARVAENIAENKGKSAPDVEDFREAAEAKNTARRSGSTSGKNLSIMKIEPILVEMEDTGGVAAHWAAKIREALG